MDPTLRVVKRKAPTTKAKSVQAKASALADHEPAAKRRRTDQLEPVVEKKAVVGEDKGKDKGKDKVKGKQKAKRRGQAAKARADFQASTPGPIQRLSTRDQHAYFIHSYLAVAHETLGISKDEQRQNANLLSPSHFKVLDLEHPAADPLADRTVDELPSFLSDVVGEDGLTKLPRKEEVKGAPRCLVVSAAALRACAFVKALSEFNKRVKIGKLFAKHIKVQEQVTFLKENVTRLCVGTPHRMAQLCELEALSLGECEYVVLDLGRNVKRQHLLDMQDTKADFFKLFFTHVFPQVMRGTTKVVFF
eukprot:TRINITY_DN3080_c0_g1_i1.p1 TRINITY_DN3080_c0_g1~~TRINITY_DN3080_c0_g1_i1.p1  ORF type:complete len:305 (+),score=53.38 TRINITY_DN3080_c0_g1_i1:139-1053(+)